MNFFKSTNPRPKFTGPYKKECTHNNRDTDPESEKHKCLTLLHKIPPTKGTIADTVNNSCVLFPGFLWLPVVLNADAGSRPAPTPIQPPVWERKHP